MEPTIRISLMKLEWGHARMRIANMGRFTSRQRCLFLEHSCLDDPKRLEARGNSFPVAQMELEDSLQKQVMMNKKSFESLPPIEEEGIEVETIQERPDSIRSMQSQETLLNPKLRKRRSKTVVEGVTLDSLQSSDKALELESTEKEPVKEPPNGFLRIFDKPLFHEPLEFLKEEQEVWEQYYELVYENRDKHYSRTICVALDQSEKSVHALKWTIANSINKETDLILLVNVRPLPVLTGFSLCAPFISYGDVMEQMETKNRVEQHQFLHESVAFLLAEGFRVAAIALRGVIKEELSIFINDLRPDLVILGQGNPTFLHRLFVGSVSEFVQRHVACPVLLVKEQHPK
jgi:nucleotide-binding universal stress UspA family protein